MNRIFFVIGSITAAFAVMASAYGAHAGGTLNTEQVIWIEKAARFQIYHSFALICVSFAVNQWSSIRLFHLAGWLFVAGIVCFSGSLYLMAFSGINLGYFIPAGGIAFILGWGLMAVAALVSSPTEKS